MEKVGLATFSVYLPYGFPAPPHWKDTENMLHWGSLVQAYLKDAMPKIFPMGGDGPWSVDEVLDEGRLGVRVYWEAPDYREL